MTHIFMLCDHKTFIFLTVFFFHFFICQLYVALGLQCVRIIESIRLSRKALFRGKVLDSLLFNYFLDVCRLVINFLPYVRVMVINISIYVILISVVNITKLIYQQIEYPLDIWRIFNLFIARI